jgi:hypothetical protein
MSRINACIESSEYMPQTVVDTLSHSHNYTSYLPLLFITLTSLYTEAKNHLCFTSRSNPYIYIYIWMQCDSISLWSALLRWNCLTTVREQGAN